jgi:hypothetical protein
MNVRWLGRLLRGIRAGERHSILKHPALTNVPNVISVKSEWFHNGEWRQTRSFSQFESSSLHQGWCVRR